MPTKEENQKNVSFIQGTRFMFSYIKHYWISLTFVALFIIAATWLQVKAPLIMGDAIQEMTHYVIGYMKTGSSDNSTFVGIILKLIGAYGLIALAMFMYTIIMNQVSTKTSKKIRESLFKKLQGLSVRFFDESSDGDILSRFTNDIDNIANFLNQTLTQIVTSVALIIAIGYTMLRESVSLGFVVIVLAIVCLLVLLFFTKKARKYVTIQQSALGDLNGYIDEKISGQKLIITSGLEETTYNDFIPFNEAYRVSSKKGQAYSNVLFPLVNGFMLVTLSLVILFGADKVIDGTLDIALLVAFIQYTQRFFQPITQIVSQYNEFRLAITGSGRVEEVINQSEDVVSTPNAQPYQPIKNSLKLKNVSFGYKKGINILNDVNIEVEKGHKVALVGPTGSGKTTIMNLLNRFYDIQEGEILFDDVEIKDIQLESLRRNVGIVLQESVLFDGTIKDNIAFGRRDASMDEIIEAAKLANIHDIIMELEDGYDTHIDDNKSVFSVGQKQLISIARTILTDPDFLILDEATSNVDTVTEQQIQTAMNNILKGRTSFVIAHRLKTILDSDKIVVLYNGSVIEEGSHDELMAHDGFYAQLYNNQFVLED